MKVRPTRIEGDIAYVPLTKGYEAIIDATDVYLVNRWNWYASERKRRNGLPRTVYAMRTVRLGERYKSFLLHRDILSAPDDMEVDHISGDGLDNRRTNIRVASHAENLCNRRTPLNNTSGVKGVSWHKCGGKWQARITVAGRKKHIGLFNDITEAAAAYAAASAEFHGEFGRTE